MIVKLARQNHTHAQNAFLRTYDSTETLIGYSKAIEFIRDRPLLKNARYFLAKQPGNSKNKAHAAFALLIMLCTNPQNQMVHSKKNQSESFYYVELHNHPRDKLWNERANQVETLIVVALVKFFFLIDKGHFRCKNAAC